MLREFDSDDEYSETVDLDALSEDEASLSRREKAKRKLAFRKKQDVRDRLYQLQEQKWLQQETEDFYD
ncbi:hypothetical protein K0504_01260 [Neiella marina]|uniref:Uncharacterized protein n=1 Tax=Neiella holothuriorum TaxID=2870530 RepID=A0ABS7EBE9_9GAMM|nr:hypothetical protein [Neiella holothuriorum]MBW8189649.1 hypothetical protein [Neiella holothuriorum]